ncbi:MAG: tail fiber domain-containing protein, partial [Acidobacteriota bacterium]
NGGANKFSIDDIDGGRTPFTIEASTPTNSLYVDSSGRIGLGTNAPVADVHVKTGNTPTVRLEQDGSSGFTAQTWDLAGNEANFFIRDATNGSALAFRVFPGSGTSNALSIAADGDIGLGTTSPTQALDINQGSGGGNIRIVGNNVGNIMQDDTSGAQQFVNGDRYRLRGLDSAGAPAIDGMSMSLTDGVVGINCPDAFEVVAGARLVVGDGDGSCAGTFSAIIPGNGTVNTSSRTAKENFQAVDSDGILGKMANIGVYTYDYISGPKDSMGLIAEDFHQVFGRGSDKMISDREVQMAMWLAIQEMAAKIGTLEAELAAAQAD